MPLSSRERFSNRVGDYVRHRPSYPPQVMGFLRERLKLAPRWVVADIGAGTGISTRLFLENGNVVHAIEPNAAMRQAAEKTLAPAFPQSFHEADGSAEATGLADASVDLVFCAQAYHWFDREKSAREFRRILRPNPGGFVCLIWNTRRPSGSPFLVDYEALLQRFGNDYANVAHRWNMSTDDLTRAMGSPVQRTSFPHHQTLDLAGMRGRLLSSSYMPAEGQPGYAEMLVAADEVFLRHAHDGAVTLEYDTEIYWAKLA